MMLSQKLTLGYATLLGVGGFIGFAKKKSTPSLIAGVSSASALLYVYTQLPHNPVFASSLGLGISAVLLIGMGGRFRVTGKFYPAGFVSMASFIMMAGYLHGIIHLTNS